MIFTRQIEQQARIYHRLELLEKPEIQFKDRKIIETGSVLFWPDTN